MEEINRDLIKEVFGFTDIYINKENYEDSFTYNKKGNSSTKINFSNNEHKKIFISFFEEVKKSIEKDHHKKDHLVKFEGRSFRCYEIPSIEGKIIAVRQMPPEFIHFEQTGIKDQIKKELLHPRLKNGGLIIICGAPGNGKTTTCAALIDARLRQSGGLCITIEDPVEISLQGDRGEKGKCIQIQVDSNKDFPDTVRGIMRAYPTGVDSIMLIGETRDAETASEALRSSIDGRLVITTMHSSNPIEAINRFYTLASKIIEPEDVLNMLASSFRIALHQSLIKGKLITKLLIDEVEVQGAIRNNKIGSLNTALEHQEKKLAQGIDFDYMKRL